MIALKTSFPDVREWKTSSKNYDSRVAVGKTIALVCWLVAGKAVLTKAKYLYGLMVCVRVLQRSDPYGACPRGVSISFITRFDVKHGIRNKFLNRRM